MDIAEVIVRPTVVAQCSLLTGTVVSTLLPP